MTCFPFPKQVLSLSSTRLVPAVLQRPQRADARALCPGEQMRHPRATVACGDSPQEEGRRRQTQRVRPLEEELLRLPLQPDQGEEVSRQLLRLPVHQAHSLLPGLLRRYLNH